MLHLRWPARRAAPALLTAWCAPACHDVGARRIEHFAHFASEPSIDHKLLQETPVCVCIPRYRYIAWTWDLGAAETRAIYTTWAHASCSEDAWQPPADASRGAAKR